MKPVQKALPLILICCLMAAAAGCFGMEDAGQKGTASDSSSWEYGGVPTPVPTPPPMYNREESATGSSPSAATETKIIRTGSVSLEVPDVLPVIETINGIATANGGYLSSSNVYSGQGDRQFGSLTIRVPAKNFDATLSAVKATGKVENENVQATDVTEEYVDLSARKNSLTNQRDQYRKLLQKAETVEEILKVQVEIDRVQMELDRLQGRLTYLDSRIDLATLTVNLQEPEPVGGETGFSLVSSVNAGIAGLLGMVSALVILAFTLLPLAILVVIVYLVYRWYRKRKGGAVSAPPAPAQPA